MLSFLKLTLYVCVSSTIPFFVTLPFPLIEAAGLAGVYHILKMDIDQSNQS